MNLKSFIYNIKKFGPMILGYKLLEKMHLVDSSLIFQVHYNKYFQKCSEGEFSNELREWFDAYAYYPDNIDKPTTFNGKIQFLKFKDVEKKTKLTDKYAVRSWIAEKIGEEYLIPLYGVWDSVDDIPFDSLPKQFVLKTNHSSGTILIIKDKGTVDIKKVKRILDRWLHTPFGYIGMEVQYFNIPRKIIAEKYIEQNDGNLLDYKIYCFNGEPFYFQMIGNRDLKRHNGRLAFYDTEWNLMNFNSGDYPEYEYKLEKPKCLKQLIDISRILSREFQFVRVDLYVIDDCIKFGEMTFTPANGNLPWKPESANLLLGELLQLK